jgi:hypothetical protein
MAGGSGAALGARCFSACCWLLAQVKLRSGTLRRFVGVSFVAAGAGRTRNRVTVPRP